MVHSQTLAYSLGIVIAASRLFAPKHHTLHKLVLGHFKPYDSMYFLTATLHHIFESQGLRYRAWEAVKDDAFGCLVGVVVKFMLEYTKHQFVRDKLSLRNIAVGSAAQFGAACDMVAKDLTRRNVMQMVAVYEFFALGPLYGAAFSVSELAL